MKCFVCKKAAEYTYLGTSLCDKHVEGLREYVGTGERTGKSLHKMLREDYEKSLL